MWTFYFHYHKQASKRVGRPQVSVHFRDQCYIVDNLVCERPCRGRIRKRQPFFVMAGKAREFRVERGVGVLR